MDALGPWHIIIIVAFVVILFGAKKLPDAARSLGRSARIMKSEMKGLHEEPAVEETPAGPVEAARPVLADEMPVRPVLADEMPVRPVLADEVPVTARHNGTR